MIDFQKFQELHGWDLDRNASEWRGECDDKFIACAIASWEGMDVEHKRAAIGIAAEYDSEKMRSLVIPVLKSGDAYLRSAAQAYFHNQHGLSFVDELPENIRYSTEP